MQESITATAVVTQSVLRSCSSDPCSKCTLWNCYYLSPCDLVEHNSNFVCNKEVFIFLCQSSKLCRVQWPLEQELCMYQENLFSILTSAVSISSWRRISFWDDDISIELWLLNKKLTPFWLFDLRFLDNCKLKYVKLSIQSQFHWNPLYREVKSKYICLEKLLFWCCNGM